MKKFLTVILSMFIIFCLFTACGGATAGHIREINGNTLYSEAEINKAMDIAEKCFKGNFDGCILYLLSYDEAFSKDRSEGWKKQYNSEDAIVLTSSFYVDKRGGDGSLNPDSVYKNYQWILIKENGFWTLKTWGYG